MPWLRPRLRHLDAASLHWRLAIALALAAALPLILAGFLTGGRTARAAETQALGAQETLARALAHDVANYVNIHRTAVIALAAQPNLLALPREAQVAVLDATNGALPDTYSFSVVDVDGNILARSNGRLRHAIADQPSFRTAKATNQPSFEVRILTATQRPAFVFVAPIRGQNGEFIGAVRTSLEAATLAKDLAAGGGAGVDLAYLVDDQGRAIAHPDDALIASFTNLAHLPPVATLLADADGIGSVSYAGTAGSVLSSYARVPGLGWGVVVEQSSAQALAVVRLGQDINFGLLLLVIVLAAGAGALAAGYLTAPLATLTHATSRLTAGETTAALPKSQVTEVAQLATVFGTLRDQLATRTVEREAAAARLQFLADAGVQLSTSLEYETTLKRVAELAVPFLADFSLVDVLNADGQIERLATVHHDPARQDLVDRMRRFVPWVDSQAPVARVIRTGVPSWLLHFTHADRAMIALSAEHRALIEELAPTSAMIVPLVARGRVLGAISFVRSSGSAPYTVEDVRLAEELVRRAGLAIDNARLYREAQTAIKVRDEFLSIASHEFKTPITALLGHIYLTERRARREGTETSREHRALRTIREQAERLNKLITLLLDVSRLELERFRLDRRPIDLRALVQRVVTEVEPTLERHTLELVAPETPVMVDGDELRLEQVVQNLLSNAIKYSPLGGSVTIRLDHGLDGAALTIQDQGIGIPETSRARLFQRFYRAGNVDHLQISGFGVGLYLVQEIVTAHGGRVEVASEEGRGSTFTMHLPLMGQSVAATLDDSARDVVAVEPDASARHRQESEGR